MKQWIISITIFIFSYSQQCAACPRGSIEYEGVCAEMPDVADAPVYVKPSDEKPPRDKMPSYEREGIKALMLPSLTMQDEAEDQARAKANEEGLRKAGIKP